MKKQQPRLGGMILYGILLVALVVSMVRLLDASGSAKLKYSEVVDLFTQEKVDAFQVENGVLDLELKEAYKGQTELKYKLPDFSSLQRGHADRHQLKTRRKLVRSPSSSRRTVAS